jgi:hypothetical protein
MAAIAEQKKRKIQYPERPNFLCEYEYMADYNPGPGNYNPRVSVFCYRLGNSVETQGQQHQAERNHREA